MNGKLGARKWSVLLLVGLFGQFAWTIENMYFNLFLYNTILQDPDYIAAMVAWSAAAATVTTLLTSRRRTRESSFPAPMLLSRRPPWWWCWTA